MSRVHAVTLLALVLALFAPQTVRAEGSSVPVGGKCASDDQCVLGAGCSKGVCARLQAGRSFPLYVGKEGAITPILGYRKDPRAGTETAIALPYVYRRNDVTQTRTHVFFPLFASHTAPGYQVTVQFPFVWYVRDGAERHITLFPFYWRSRTPHRSSDALFPLFFRGTSDTASTTVAGPVWWRARKDGGRSAGLFPLFAYGRVAKGASRYFGMPGAFWRKNDLEGASDLVVGPLFRATRPNGYTAGLFPVAWAWKRDTTSHVLAPFFYDVRDHAAGYSLDVIGPLYFGHDGASKKFGLFPLIFAKTDGQGGARAGVFPLLYLHTKRDGVFFTTLAFGFSTYPSGTRAWVGPFYVRRDAAASATALFPILYFGKNRQSGSSTSYLFPLLFDHRAASGRELQAYTPLVWRFHSVERSVLVGLPLFVDVHSFGESRSTMLLPLFVRNDSKVDHSTSWVFPPLLTWVRKRPAAGATDAVVFPIFWRYGGERSTTVVAPLYWDFKRGDSRTTVFFPIGARWKRPDGVHTLVLNTYYRKGLGPREGSWFCDVIPLFEVGRPHKHDLSWKVLEGLFGYSRIGRDRILTLFWLFDIKLEPAPASTLTWFGSTPPSARTEL